MAFTRFEDIDDAEFQRAYGRAGDARKLIGGLMLLVTGCNEYRKNNESNVENSQQELLITGGVSAEIYKRWCAKISFYLNYSLFFLHSLP